MNKLEKIYAVYRGDKFIVLGNKKEIAEYLGIKPRTISNYRLKAYKRKTEYHKRIIIIEIEDN